MNVAAVTEWESHCLARSGLGFDPGRVGIFNKEFLPETRRDGGTQPQSLVSVPNIPELNSKSPRSACDMEAYVLLVAIRPSDG